MALSQRVALHTHRAARRRITAARVVEATLKDVPTDDGSVRADNSEYLSQFAGAHAAVSRALESNIAKYIDNKEAQ